MISNWNVLGFFEMSQSLRLSEKMLLETSSFSGHRKNLSLSPKNFEKQLFYEPLFHVSKESISSYLSLVYSTVASRWNMSPVASSDLQLPEEPTLQSAKLIVLDLLGETIQLPQLFVAMRWFLGWGIRRFGHLGSLKVSVKFHHFWESWKQLNKSG